MSTLINLLYAPIKHKKINITKPVPEWLCRCDAEHINTHTHQHGQLFHVSREAALTHTKLHVIKAISEHYAGEHNLHRIHAGQYPASVS